MRFVYQKVYNDIQNVRVYAMGNRVAWLKCTTEACGTEQTVSIPEECIEDDIFVIRMVFPNAVTPHQLDVNDLDSRILSIGLEKMVIE